MHKKICPPRIPWRTCWFQMLLFFVFEDLSDDDLLVVHDVETALDAVETAAIDGATSVMIVFRVLILATKIIIYHETAK